MKEKKGKSNSRKKERSKNTDPWEEVKKQVYKGTIREYRPIERTGRR